MFLQSASIVCNGFDICSIVIELFIKNFLICCENNTHVDFWGESEDCIFRDNWCIGSGVGMYSFRSKVRNNWFVSTFSDGKNHSIKDELVGIRPSSRAKAIKRLNCNGNKFVGWDVGIEIKEQTSSTKFEANQYMMDLSIINDDQFINCGKNLYIDYDHHKGGLVDWKGSIDGKTGVWFGKDGSPSTDVIKYPM